MGTPGLGLVETDSDNVRAPGAGRPDGGQAVRPRERFANDMTAALRHNTTVNLVVSVVSALFEQGLTSVATGAGSLIAAIVGVLKHVPRNIGHNLADTIQIQSIITGCDRQISLLEGAALAVFKKDLETPAGHEFVLQAQAQIDQAVDRAVRRIERYADPGAAPATD